MKDRLAPIAVLALVVVTGGGCSPPGDDPAVDDPTTPTATAPAPSPPTPPSPASAADHLADRIAEAREAVAASPEDPDLRLELGELLLRAGRSEAAVDELQALLELDPDHPGAHYDLGLVRMQEGRLEAAEEHFRAVLAAVPEAQEPHIQLGELARRRGDFEAALGHYQRLVEVAPDVPPARFWRAVTLLRLDRRGEALGYLEEDLRASPRAPGLRFLIARLLASAPEPELRDGERAVSIARGLYDDRAVLSSAEALAAAYAETGDFDRAVAWQEAALAAAREAGNAPAVERIEERLHRYRRGEPSRVPWRPGELEGSMIRVEPPASDPDPAAP